MVLHDLRRVRGAVPGRHRARRRDRRHAPLPGAHRVGVPRRAERPVQEPGEELEPVGHGAADADGLGQGPAVRRAGRRRFRIDGRRVADRGRLPVLGRLRRRAGGPGQADHPRGGRAAAHRRRLVRGARRRRGLHRRPRPPGRERVPVPDARPAERRDPQRGRRDEDRRHLRALLQHAEERVPPGRWQLRGGPPHPAAQPAGPRQTARARLASGRRVVAGGRLDRADA